MNSNYSYDAIQALLQARDFLRSKDNLEATRWAKAAVALEPLMEEGWLILAACAQPQESIQYLNQALKINPASQRARQGMAWAVKRLREIANSKTTILSWMQILKKLVSQKN